ncbi:MAG: hypothetical protein CBD51_000550 [Flavobacteriales bacterium TMED191]|nr:MAG: hypothetical protein CBD51_000550 [Flavobacteriales bacterium TMED191]
MKQLYILFFVSLSLFSQNIVLDVDTNLLRIGEQFNVTMNYFSIDSLDINLNQAENLFDEFEVLKESGLEKMFDIDTFFYKNYLLTSFDTGIFILSPKIITQQNLDTLSVNPISITFLPVELDSANKFFDIKPPKDVPFKLKELLGYKYVFLILLLILLIYYFTYKYVFKTSNIQESREVIKIPVDIYYLNKIKELSSKKYLEEDKFQLYYTRLSEILRGYLEHRFDIPALESSTYDLKLLLRNININEEWLNDFLRVGDLVKFAKGLPSKKVSESFLKSVKLFIKANKIKPVEENINDINL